jgi:excisionase family DNA binding protein
VTNANARTGPVEPISVRIPEAVRLTGLSRSRIYELMASGDIQFAKVGSSTLIMVRSLRQFIEGRRQAGARPDFCEGRDRAE